jgi:hypothetical protein
MKKDTKVDLVFSAVMFIAILGVAFILSLCGVLPANVYLYETRLLPWICFATVMVHVVVTGRISGLFLILETVFLFAGAVYTNACLRPQDALGAVVGDGMLIGLLQLYIVAISVLIEAFGVFVMSRIRKRSITT